MAVARSFTDLLFWQRARQWSKDIFHRSKQQPFAADQRLCIQINDSSESVMANMIRKLTVAFIRSMIMPRGGVRVLGRPPSWSSRVWEIYERVTGQPRPEIFATPNDQQPVSRNDEPPI